MEGFLKMISSEGYGFIRNGHIDFFFHHSQLEGDWQVLIKQFVSLKEGEKIILEFQNDPSAPNGPRAIKVKVKGN